MDLIVDGSLDDTNRDLKAIHDEFNSLQDSANENKGIWGHSDVAAAMNDFAHDWYVHRDKINNRLGKLSGQVDQACNVWSDAEKQLSASLQTTSDGGGDA